MGKCYDVGVLLVQNSLCESGFASSILVTSTEFNTRKNVLIGYNKIIAEWVLKNTVPTVNSKKRTSLHLLGACLVLFSLRKKYEKVLPHI